MINPANFIQYQDPDRAFDGDNAQGYTPLGLTLDVFDWVAANSESPRYFIYEGWADMGTIARSFPPSKRALRKYHRFNRGDYHDWFVTYLGEVKSARPDLDVTLIPVASILSELLSDGPLEALSAEDLYVDTAPHGTPTTYFLAAMITYGAYFGEAAPADFEIPDTISPVVKAAYPELRQVISDLMGEYQQAALPPAVTQIETVAAKTRALGLDNPPLAMGLNGIADWSTQHPFINVMKTARPWIGHRTREWGGFNVDDLAEMEILDANGYPTRIPSTLRAVEALVLTDQPKEATSLRGKYRLTYKGKGNLKIKGRARRVFHKNNVATFTFEPGEGPIGIEITSTDPDGTGDYIRDIEIIHEDLIPLAEVGALFNPYWVAEIADLRSVRFMDWMFTNGSSQSRWEERPLQGDFTWGWRGVPVEVMVDLSNLIGADPWFNMPHLADDTYMRNFATYVRDNIDPQRKSYVEFSNEIWNFTFPQAVWVGQKAEEAWGENAAPDAWMQMAGLRAAEMADIWTEVFGDRAEEHLVRVIATHTDWPGLEEGAFFAPLGLKDDPNRKPPVESFDAYAVTGYFGFDLGTDEGAPEVVKWLEEAREVVEAEGRAKGLRRVSLQLYVDENLHAPVVARAIDKLANGSLRELVEEVLPLQAEIAEKHGLEMLMYEGGTHVVGIGGWVSNDELAKFFNYLNYTPEMGALYDQLLSGWVAAGGTLFNAFVDVSPPSQFGSWGAKRYLEDKNPRSVSLARFNSNVQAWWEDRSIGSFDHGAVFPGTDGADRLEGTAARDVMIAARGDDVVLVNGPMDRIHGGEGRDKVILPGQRADYEFSRDGARLVAKSAIHGATMVSVEILEFAGEAGQVLTVEDLI